MAVIDEPFIPEITLRHRLGIALEESPKRVSKGQMARKLGLSEGTISNYLAGRTQPKPLTIRAWAAVTGVDYDWLAGNEDTTPGGDDDPGDLGFSMSR